MPKLNKERFVGLNNEKASVNNFLKKIIILVNVNRR